MRMAAHPRNKTGAAHPWSMDTKGVATRSEKIHASRLSAMLPSSTKSPNTLRSIAVNPLSMSRTPSRPRGGEYFREPAPRGRNHDQRGEQKAGGEPENRQVITGPVKTEPFADPEDAESGDQNSDRELERVLGHAGEQAAERQAESQDQDARRRGPGARRDQHMADRADGDDDEDDLQPLEHDRFEGGRDRDGVPADGFYRSLPAQA